MQHPLNQTQILRKISKSGVSTTQQYTQIIQSLQQQGLKLSADRQQLKIRVNILLQKQQELLQQHRNNKKNPKVDYNSLKMQLQRKYKQFQAWQRKCYNSINKGALNLQVKDYLNRCAIVQSQIAQQRQKLRDEKKTYRRIQKSLKSQLKYLNKNIPQTQMLQQQNKQLRRAISNIRIVQDLTGHVDVRVHSSIINLQNKKKFVEKLKTMTIQDIKRMEAKEKMDIVNEGIKSRLNRQKEMENDGRNQRRRRLKSQSRASSKNSIETIIKTEENGKQEEIKQKNQELKNNQNQLNSILSQKNKSIQQQNTLNSILKQQQQKLQKKQQLIDIEHVDISLQATSFQDQNPLFMQIVGNETLLLQDDRSVLKTSKDTLITGIVGYENKLGIACIRALYSNGKQTLCVVPEVCLEKCKPRKMILGEGKDFMKWVKVFYDTMEKKIVRVEIFSMNRVKFQIGKQKQRMFRNVVLYKFDVGAQEIPVCLRASYRVQDGDWILASLGFQINCK